MRTAKPHLRKPSRISRLRVVSGSALAASLNVTASP
jgi:hypothetical protein